MSFTLKVDADRWRDQLRTVLDCTSKAGGTALVPVIKGNGYGLGQALLAREAAALGVDSVAVGTIFEIDEVLALTTCDVIVLEPFEPRDEITARAWWQASERPDASRLIRTISSASALQTLVDGPGDVRIMLEAQTSMHRFGMDERELLSVLADPSVRSALSSGHVQVVGLSLHLPMVQPADEVSVHGTKSGNPRVREVVRWAGLWQAETAVWTGSHAPSASVWVSHLSDPELTEVTRIADEIALRSRVGTRLWLGDRRILTAQGTVLAVHPLAEGTHVGYRQRTGPKDGTLVVISGGTAHGIGLTAPTPAASIRQRVVTAGTGALDAVGRALSPFTWEGKQRWFAEPPHQHHSMLWLPKGCVIPSVGDTMAADVRFTTSRFDAVLGLD
jgi:alanine racemase